MDSAFNSSLGELNRLPAEIRNAIYELAINSSDEHINLLGRCIPYSSLAFVSKQMHAETIGIINKCFNASCGLNNMSNIAATTCRHDAFQYMVPAEGLREAFNDWREASGSVIRHQLQVFPVTVKFVTGHLHQHAPISVSVEIYLFINQMPQQQGTSSINRSAGCNVIGYEGGHKDVRRVLEPQVHTRLKELQAFWLGITEFDEDDAESCLTDVAEILQSKCLAADEIIAKSKKARRFTNEKREEKRQQEVERRKKAKS